jgi:AraC-like DNA-binding protein
MESFPDIRMDGVYYGFAEFEPPWCVVVPPNDSAYLYVVRAGACWFQSSEGSAEPIHVPVGSIVGVAGGQSVIWRDSLDTPIADIETLFPMRGFEDEVTGAADSGSATRFMVGCVSRSTNLLIAMLPSFIYVSPEIRGSLDRLNQTLELIETEMRLEGGSEVGPQSVVRRLSENIAIEFARIALKQDGDWDNNWLAGLKDRYVTRALTLMNVQPEASWTVQSLATEVGLGRSAFADRFGRLVGEGPAAFLLKVRIRKAAALAREGRLSLKEIAVAVGYQSEAAFNRAFARQTGETPGRFRSRVRHEGSRRS